MNFKRVKISTTVPLENADQVREALGKAGAGSICEYRYCSFSVTGKGRFLPTDKANPHIGESENSKSSRKSRLKSLVIEI